MLIDVETTQGTYQADLDQVWVWVRLERELGLTVTEAQEKMAAGSTHIISYAIWIGLEAEAPYEQWVKDLKSYKVVNDFPKATTRKRSSTT